MILNATSTHTTVLSKIKKFEVSKNAEIKLCSTLLFLLFKFITRNEQIPDLEKMHFLTAIESVENDEPALDTDAPFEGFSFFTRSMQHSVRECYRTGKYLSTSQPLREVRNALENKRYRSDDVMLFIDNCLVGFKIEKEYRRKPIQEDAPVYY